jgi:restriction endonuclease S subunit
MIEEQTLPDGWSVVQFDEIIESSLYGCNPTNGEDVEGIPFLRISDITPDGKLKQQELPKKADVDREDAEKYGLEFGDVVVARSGSVGQNYVYNPQHGEMVYASYLIRFTLDVEQVLPKFIKMYFQSPMYWRQVHRNSRAAAQPNLNAGEIKDFVVPLPPINEQERIVSLLDDALASLDRVAELSEQVDDYADEFINAISHLQFEQSSTLGEWDTCELDEAVEYKSNLTKPKGTPDQEFTLLDLEDWRLIQLNELGTRLRSTTDPSESGDTKFEYYSFPAYDDGRKPRFTLGSEINSRKRELHGGELLIARLNPRIQRVWAVSDSENPKIASTEFVAVDITSEDVNKRYLIHFFQSEMAEKILCSKVTGAVGSRSRVSYDDVMEVEIPLPPLNEQERIVSLLDDALASLDRGASLSKQIDDYADELRGSFLQQAFVGELLSH